MSLYLHAVTLVIAASAALAGVVGVCAGTSSRHWFWRALGLWAVVAGMLPIRSYEPALVLAVGLPVVAVSVRAMRWLAERKSGNGAASMYRVRFGVRDVLLVMALLGLALAVGLHLVRSMSTQSDWLRAKRASEIIVPAISMAVIGVLGWYLVRGRRWWWGVLGLMAAVGGFAWALPGHADWIYALDDHFGVLSLAPNRDRLAFLVALVGMAEYGALFVGLTWSLGPRTTWPRFQRVVGYTGLVLGGVPVAVVYCQMLTLTPFPPSQEATEIERRVVEIAQRVKTINEDSLPTNELEATVPGVAAEMQSLHAELLPILPAARTLAGDLSSLEAQQLREHTDYEHWRAVRILGRCLNAEAKTAALRGDSPRAAELALAVVRLGAANCQGGIMIDDLVGRALMGYGFRTLASGRKDFDDKALKRIIEALGSIDSMEESTATVIQRDMAYCERVYGWQMRFSNILARVTQGEVDEWENFASFIAAVRCWRAVNRLLQIDLAIRGFREQNGRLPATIDDLVPNWLAAAPSDPFSEQPIVYRITGEEDGFLLYSVGRGGRDDGGRFTKLTTYHSDNGYDLDLDTLTRP
jgi:hypothetical protein